jgi:hypothetical protein
MSSNTWWSLLASQQAAGPTLTAAAAASMLIGSTPAAGQNRFTLPANTLAVGTVLNFKARGIISCAVTTPGTARFDLRFGSTVIFDSGALSLDIVAKTNVPWTLDVDLTCRAIGATTAAQLWGQGTWSSEAVIGSPLNSAGGNGLLNVPVGSLALSTGFDSTVANVVDSFFTQTVATGSMTCEQAFLTLCN